MTDKALNESPQVVHVTRKAVRSKYQTRGSGFKRTITDVAVALNSHIAAVYCVMIVNMPGAFLCIVAGLNLSRNRFTHHYGQNSHILAASWRTVPRLAMFQ